MGQLLSKNDFYAIILGSLPSSYDPYISAVNATSSILGKTVSADDLMLTVTEEYEHWNLQNKSGEKEENSAFYSNNSRKGGKGSSSKDLKKKNVKCYNCHKKGHYKHDCWLPGRGKEGQGPKQKGKGKQKSDNKEMAAASTEGKATTETKGKEKKKEAIKEAWLAMIDNSYDDEDDLEEIISTPDVDNTNLVLTVNPTSHIDPIVNLFVNSKGTYTSTFSTEQLAGSAETQHTKVDLYDSGASQHMPRFHHKFMDFVKIKPVPIRAADKWVFRAIGKGKLMIHLPNGDKGMSQIQLTEALYAPSMGVTLISISHIVAASSTIIFSREFCWIYNPDKKRVGEIKESGGLY